MQKTPSGYAIVRKLVEQADVLIDPFRPGVMERLKLGPEVFLGIEKAGVQGSNKRLVYARLVGFPREGRSPILRPSCPGVLMKA